MDLIYLDYNCFQRSFDDIRQIKIRLEAPACEAIFARAERKDIRLVWSFMHEDENILCPFVERKLEVYRLATICETKIGQMKKYIILPRISNKKQICLQGMLFTLLVHIIPRVFSF